MNGMDAPSLGLFFSQVHLLPTKPEIPKNLQDIWRPLTSADRDWLRRMGSIGRGIPPAEASEIAFRHRGWIQDRVKVREAMRTSGLPAARLERFDNCGADCVIEVAADGSRYRVRANHCGDRFCQPCMKARGRKICKRIEKKIYGQATSHLVLTLKHNDDGVRKRLNHLLASFVRLRATKYFKGKVRGGLAAVEIKRGRDSGLWHLHLHCLLLAKWLDIRRLSKLWFRASQGACVLKVRRVTDNDKAVRYIAKYATKGWSNEIVESQADLRECMVALRGRRLLLTWGAWRGDVEDDQPKDDTTWKRLGRLDAVAHAAAIGQAWAVGVFASMKVHAFKQGGAVVFGRIAQDKMKPDGRDSPSGDGS